MNPNRLPFFFRSLVTRTLLVACAGISNTNAADRAWNVASGDFNNGANWNASFSGAWNTTADNAVISNSGTATMSAGSATLVQIWVGQNASGTANGSLVQTGGSITLSDGLVVGRQGSAIGAYTMSGGTLSTQRLRLGGGTGTSSGTMTISGAGTILTTTESGTNVVAIGSPGTGSLTLSNSAVWNHTGSTVVEVGGVNSIMNGAGGKGTLLIQSGASMTLSSSNLAIGRNASSLGGSSVTVDGGSLTLSGATAAINVGSVNADNNTTSAGTGTLTLASGTITASKINVALNTGALAGSGNGTVNFNGGTAIIGGISKGGGTGTVNFNGSTIQASANNPDFYSGFTTAGLNIQAGGQTFNTNGKTVTIAQGMSGTGTFTKTGAGKLVFSGNSTYKGPTSVNDGSLVINGAVTSTVTVNNGGTLGGSGGITGDLTVKSGGTHAIGNSPGSQTISGNASYENGSIFTWDLAANLDGDVSDGGDTGTAGTVYDTVNITGNLDLSSGAIFRVVQNTGLDFTNGFWGSSQMWNDIFNVTGTTTSAWSNTPVSVYDTAGSLVDVSSYGSFSMSGTTLSWTAVPEPGYPALALLLGFGIMRRRRN